MTQAGRDVALAIAGAAKAAHAMAKKQGCTLHKEGERYRVLNTTTRASVVAGTLSQVISFLNARQRSRKA